MSPAADPHLRRRAWFIFAALVGTYIASQFYRASLTVIAPDLMRDLALSAESIGGIAGLFFLVFGLVQLPVGVLLDRFGPRNVMPVLFLIAVLGALVFAAAESGLGLAAGRSLLGLGCAAGLMGAMVVFGRWFPREKFATMGGVLMGVSSIGVLLAATPLAWASATIGWREAFVISAVVTVLLAGLLYLVVRDAPPDMAAAARVKESPREILAGIGTVMKNRLLWRIVAMQLTIYPSVMTVATLWAGPYLNDVHGLDTEQRGDALNVLYGALVVSPLLFGPLDRVFDTRKWVVIGSAVALTVILLTFALWPQPALWQALVLLLLLGLASAGSLVLHAHARSALPERLIGRGMTLQNTASIGGIFLWQAATGFIIGAFDAPDGVVPEIAYRAAFGFLGGMLLLSLSIYAWADDVKPGHVAAAD